MLEMIIVAYHALVKIQLWLQSKTIAMERRLYQDPILKDL